MRAKSMVLILIALGCGLVASIGISQVMERNAGAGVETPTVQIYVAATDIDLNDQLTGENVKLEDWPQNKVPEGSISKLEELNERFARTRMFAGEPIVARKLVESMFTTSVLIPDGYRVVSLSVKMDTAVSGLVQPGDRVDIIGFFRQGGEIARTTTRKVLSNVRVFAVNQETEQGVDEHGKTFQAKTVSVLVKQRQVERLMMAKQLGQLSLSLLRPNESMADEGGDQEFTVEELFGSPTEQADDKVATTADKGGNSAIGNLLGFLDKIKEQQPNDPVDPAGEVPTKEPVWRITVLTPEGSTKLVWHDANELPVEEATLVGPPQLPPMDPAAGGAGGPAGAGAGGGGAASGPGGGPAGAGGGNPAGSSGEGDGDASSDTSPEPGFGDE